MMAAQRQRQTGLSILRRLSPATPDEDHVSPADGATNSTQLSGFMKSVKRGACASQCCSFADRALPDLGCPIACWSTASAVFSRDKSRLVLIMAASG